MHFGAIREIVPDWHGALRSRRTHRSPKESRTSTRRPGRWGPGGVGELPPRRLARQLGAWWHGVASVSHGWRVLDAVRQCGMGGASMAWVWHVCNSVVGMPYVT